MTLLVGTSGWQYADWREPFYAGVPQRRWFEHVLAAFRTTELNVSFYRLPKRETFEGWARRSPADAIVTVKASRYLTHVKRLRDPAPSVALLVERATGLGAKLGPVLVQLPPDLHVDVDGLRATLDAFPSGVRVAVEPRHDSWWTDEVRDVLAAHGATLVWADREERSLGPLWRTADWGYLRLHAGAADVWPFYRPEALAGWVDRLTGTWPDDADVFVYFNNDPGCAAVHDAVHFAAYAEGHGHPVSRVPQHPEVAYACGARSSTRLPNGSSL
ncbi:MAG TPA: DUF72 domain-containing protein [Mycobacteriales bacterium]|nr:DUF72 domain-containing protein [Mycobacteriales bacterium]